MPVSAIRCIHAEGSGCYGHNGADDVALDAALLARAAAGRPVRVQWMRDDEFMWEPYGAAMVMRARAALKDGRIVDWNYDVWSNTHNMRPGDPEGVNLLASWYLAKPKQPGPPRALAQPAGGGDRNAIPLYDLPRQRMTSHLIKEMPLRVSALRTLGAYANVFAIELFMDELAAAARADPVAFRLAHLKDPRAKAVIEAAAKAADWKPGEKGDGTHGRGIALCEIQDARDLCGGHRRARGRPRQRPDQGAARLRGGRFRPDHQSQTGSPTRSRAASSSPRAGRCMSRCGSTRPGIMSRELGQLSDPDHARGAPASRSC